MTAREPRPPAIPIVALGLSAIDLLSCALVSGLVMFFVLASPRAAAPFEGGRKGDSSGLILRYAPETAGVVMVLRFVQDGAPGAPPTFYSDAARSMHFIRDEARRAPLVLPQGTIQEHKSVVRDTYTYNMLQMRPARWKVLLIYADTEREMASAVPATAKVKVDLQGHCAVSLECDVGPPGSSVSLESDAQCAQTSDKSCSVSAILDEIARPKARGK